MKNVLCATFFALLLIGRYCAAENRDQPSNTPQVESLVDLQKNINDMPTGTNVTVYQIFYKVDGSQIYLDIKPKSADLSPYAIKIRTENVNVEIQKMIDLVRAKGCGTRAFCGAYSAAGSIEQCAPSFLTDSSQSEKCMSMVRIYLGPEVKKPAIDFTSCGKPNYPSDSLKNLEQGTTKLLFTVDVNGKLTDSKIQKSSGFTALDSAAQSALASCVFKPGSVDGKPQTLSLVIDYVWTIPKTNSNPGS